LGLALAASFDAVFVAWRDWHQQRGEGWLASDTGFLQAAGRASVVFELAAEAEPSADECAAAVEVDASVGGDAEPICSVPALRDAMSLIWRVLIVWLTVIALLVLAGFVS